MASKPAIDIDKLARATQTQVRKESVDLTTLKRFPVLAWSWNLLVEPLEPVTQVNGIYVPEEAQKADEVQTTVARVLQVGPAALDGITNSGIKLSKLIPKADGSDTTAEDLVGKYIIFQRYTGHPIILRDFGDKKVLLITVPEILGGVDDPSSIRFYL